MEKIKKKILVIGSSGMMGHVLVDFLSKNSDFEIFNLAKKIQKSIFEIFEIRLEIEVNVIY